MKKITIAAPGPLKHKFIAEGLNYYQTLIKRFAILEVKLPKLKGSYADPEKRKREEEALIWKALEEIPTQRRFIVVLDERGKALKTEEFAKFLEDKLSLDKELIFVIGGPEGLSEALKHKADFVLSLSSLTLNHELALLVLAEALFRALSLMKGHPYHR
jgi:23S rRNA (pseudouridine1915-N3)-methyltransferase